MSYEWHARFELGPGGRPDRQVQDLYAQWQLLAQSVVDSGWNTQAKSAMQRQMPRYTEHIGRRLKEYESLGLATPKLEQEDLPHLPEHSFFLYVPFALAAPYISKDDELFYVHENPVRKEWVLRVPMVGGTSWKGSFRAALRWLLKTEDKDSRVIRLLGNPKEAEEREGTERRFQRGRLTFFPTFFDQLEVGVINPHSRETGAGTKPIHIEQVPRTARGEFALLYTPTIPESPDQDLPGWDEVLEDLRHVGQATYTLLAELGFGAKTASGMGRAEQEIAGAYLLLHRWVEVEPELPRPPSPEPPPEAFHPDSNEFLDETGQWPYYKSNKELEAHISGKAARTRYKKQRMAYREWRTLRDQWEAWQREVTTLKEQVQQRMVHVKLDRLGDLRELVKQVRAQTEGGQDD